MRCASLAVGGPRGARRSPGRQPAVVVVAELLGEDPAGDRDGEVGRLAPDLGQGLVAGRRDVALGALARGSASAWACLTISSAFAWASLLGLVEHRPDLVVGLGHQPAVLGQQPLALVAGLLGLEQAVLEVLLALVQRLDQGLPGELAQHQQQPEEDDDRPDGQGRLRLHRVGLRLAAVGAMAGLRRAPPRRRGRPPRPSRAAWPLARAGRPATGRDRRPTAEGQTIECRDPIANIELAGAWIGSRECGARDWDRTNAEASSDDPEPRPATGRAGPLGWPSRLRRAVTVS